MAQFYLSLRAAQTLLIHVPAYSFSFVWEVADVSLSLSFHTLALPVQSLFPVTFNFLSLDVARHVLALDVAALD